jgi:hypothetical protein
LSFASAQIPGVIYQERCVIDGGGERMLQKYFTPSRLMTFSAQRGEPNDGESVPAVLYVFLQKIYAKSEPKPFCPYIRIRAIDAFC